VYCGIAFAGEGDCRKKQSSRDILTDSFIYEGNWRRETSELLMGVTTPSLATLEATPWSL